MLRIQSSRLQAVRNATSAEELYSHLQAAIELEHSTIPPYLTALMSIKPGRNAAAAGIIASVAHEEMLHMAIAANVLNAIGGTPAIDDPHFIPAYPGPLPMGVHGALSVGLEKLTRRLVHDTFMTIEEPEEPLDLPVGGPLRARFAAASAVEPPSYATIGDFYTAIIDKLTELQPPIGRPERQVADSRWYPADELFPVKDVDDAIRALKIIIEQGEGTQAKGATPSPLDPEGDVAHYYRFAEIVYGHRLVAVDEPPGWAFAGDPVPLDPAGIWDFVADAKAADYPEHSRARVLADAFNASYTRLLASLHRVFNGEPDQLSAALALMVEMRLVGDKLVATKVPGTDAHAAPTFEYAPGTGG